MPAERPRIGVLALQGDFEAHGTLLRELGADVAQGFLYARPLPAPELEAWLAGREGAGPGTLAA